MLRNPAAAEIEMRRTARCPSGSRLERSQRRTAAWMTRAAYRSWDLDVDTALELAASYQGMVQNTDDHKEAVDAILSKRAPDFKGQ